jgi:hypothetical protein
VISPDRWRILIPDFDESSALCFSGIKIEGILVFPGPAPRASYAEVKSAIEKLGDAPEKQLLERVREALHDKKISRDQVRQARSEAFGTRIGRPPKLLK